MSRIRLFAEPAALDITLERSALVIIDMQRDFLEPGGFGEALGNDVSKLQAAVGPCKDVLGKARELGMLVIHTREGHRPDLTDAPPHKVERGDPATRIGAPGPMGRILVRGEPGHDIIAELYPAKNEPVIDKPGKGAFYQTDLDLMLRNRSIDTLMVCGVTTEVCVNTTVREANDRGVFSALPRGWACDDQGAGWHLRIGDIIASAALRARHGGVVSPAAQSPCAALLPAAQFSSTARPSLPRFALRGRVGEGKLRSPPGHLAAA
jgi:nicotinamidase-related amidase